MYSEMRTAVLPLSPRDFKLLSAGYRIQDTAASGTDRGTEYMQYRLYGAMLCCAVLFSVVMRAGMGYIRVGGVVKGEGCVERELTGECSR
jgi:hypothetical protein